MINCHTHAAIVTPNINIFIILFQTECLRSEILLLSILSKYSVVLEIYCHTNSSFMHFPKVIGFRVRENLSYLVSGQIYDAWKKFDIFPKKRNPGILVSNLLTRNLSL